MRLTYDHKGSDQQEAKRITDAGGFVMNHRVNGEAVRRIQSSVSCRVLIHVGRALCDRCSGGHPISGRLFHEGIRGRLALHDRNRHWRAGRVADRSLRRCKWPGLVFVSVFQRWSLDR